MEWYELEIFVGDYTSETWYRDAMESWEESCEE